MKMLALSAVAGAALALFVAMASTDTLAAGQATPAEAPTVLLVDRQALPESHPPLPPWHPPVGTRQFKLPEGHPPIPGDFACPGMAAAGDRATERRRAPSSLPGLIST